MKQAKQLVYCDQAQTVSCSNSQVCEVAVTLAGTTFSCVLKPGVIVGIVIAALVAVLVPIVLGLIFCKKLFTCRKQQPEAKPEQVESRPTSKLAIKFTAETVEQNATPMQEQPSESKAQPLPRRGRPIVFPIE